MGAVAQTLYTTEDYKKDRALWTDPAYYLNNTVRENVDMQVDVRFGQEGSGKNTFDIVSPYPYQTSEEHFEALRAEANGGTEHTLETLPDWDGVWLEDTSYSWLSGTQIQLSTVAAALTPDYQEHFVQQAKAEAEGRHWWAGSFCYPEGFMRLQRQETEFSLRPKQVWFLNGLIDNQVRRIYVGAEHTPPEAQYPQWMGESIGFWNGDTLVIHTNQIRQWNMTHSMFEWSAQLSAVEQYRREGDAIVGELTIYDPIAFTKPLNTPMKFNLRGEPGGNIRLSYNSCTDTNNVYVTEAGLLDERSPDDPQFFDPSNPRPWASHFALGEQTGARR